MLQGVGSLEPFKDPLSRKEKAKQKGNRPLAQTGRVCGEVIRIVGITIAPNHSSFEQMMDSHTAKRWEGKEKEKGHRMLGSPMLSTKWWKWKEMRLPSRYRQNHPKESRIQRWRITPRNKRNQRIWMLGGRTITRTAQPMRCTRMYPTKCIKMQHMQSTPTISTTDHRRC